MINRNTMAVFGACLLTVTMFGCGEKKGSAAGSKQSAAPVTAPPADAPGVSAQTQEQMQRSRQKDAALRSAAAAKSVLR